MNNSPEEEHSIQQPFRSTRQNQHPLFWSICLGLLLFVLNAVFFFLVAFSKVWGIKPDLGDTSSNGDPYLEFKFFLLIALVFCLAGVVLGWVSGKVSTVTRIAAFASFIGSGAMVALAYMMVIFGIGAEYAGWTFISVAFGGAFWIGVEVVAGIVGGTLGGLVGSQLPHQEPP